MSLAPGSTSEGRVFSSPRGSESPGCLGDTGRSVLTSPRNQRTICFEWIQHQSLYSPQRHAIIKYNRMRTSFWKKNKTFKTDFKWFKQRLVGDKRGESKWTPNSQENFFSLSQWKQFRCSWLLKGFCCFFFTYVILKIQIKTPLPPQDCFGVWIPRF